MDVKTRPNISISAIFYIMVAVLIMQGYTLVMAVRHLTPSLPIVRELGEVNTALLKMRLTVQSLEHKIGELKLIEGFEVMLDRITAVDKGIRGAAGRLSARVELLDVAYGDQRWVSSSGITTARSGVTPDAYRFTLVAELARQEDLSKLVEGIKSQPWLLDIGKTESEGNRATIGGRVRRGFETGSGNT
jgi:hypothetical protein